MSDFFKTIREANLAVAGLRTLLSYMSAVFTACVAIAAGLAGGMYYKLFEIAPPVSRIPAIEESVQRLSTKIDDLTKTIVEMHTQLADASSDLGAIKVAIRPSDIVPRPIPSPLSSNGPDAYSFPGVIGVPIYDLKFASDLLGKVAPSDGRTWIFSVDKNLIKAISGNEPPPLRRP